jgi:hypothetical protein
MALPSQYYYACFPLQEYFVDKDTGFPLAAGYVEFYSDPNFTVPKNVFQQNQAPGPTYTYVSLGHVLTLSSVGTFQDNNGIDIIPYLYPFTGTPPANPDTAPTGTIEPYFIRVYSSGGILQFTREGWPPQLQSQSALVDTFESSQNAITNSQFSTVSFVSDTLNQVSYTYAPTGTYSFDVAPGWQIVTTGNGSVTVKQLAIATNPVPGTPFAYALEITTDANITDCKLVQKIINTPRLYQDLFVSACLTAASNTDAVTIDMIYAPSNGVTPTTIMSQQTIGGGLYKQLIGLTSALLPAQITEADNFAPPAYVDIKVTIPVARTITITAVQMVTVANANSYVPYAAQSVPQQTNTTFWHYKPLLEYKPIPSYTLGWDWPMNPCQELGTTVAAASTLPGLSRYVADETIIFQNVDNSLGFSFNSAGMGVNPSADSSFAIIKYFEASEAANILSTPLSVQLKAGGAIASTDDVIANVSIWYTFDANLPDIKTGNRYSLVSSVNNTTGVPTVGGGGSHGTWSEVPRSNLGPAKANLKTANVPYYNFSGWVYDDATPATSVKYAAIVISVSKLAAGIGCTFEYCTLNAGYIPTRPQPMSFGENLTALQQFYEKSFNTSQVPAALIQSGTVAFPSLYSDANAVGVTVYYKTTKRKPPSSTAGAGNLTIYSYNNLTAGAISDGGGTDRNVVATVTGENCFWFNWNSVGTPANSQMQFHWISNARLGVQN